MTADLVASACIDARYAVSWRGMAALEVLLRRALADDDLRSALGIAPFFALLLPLPPDAASKIASAHARFLLQGASRLRLPPPSPTLSSMRISFLRGSSNSNAERVAALLSLDAASFETRLFSSRFEPSALRELSRLLHPAPLHHVDLGETDAVEGDGSQPRGLAEHVAATRIAASRPHVLVDCSGHTAGGFVGALARRPAHVSVGALGFPGSYGGGLVDYITADRVVAQPVLQAGAVRGGATAFAERLAILPVTYVVAPWEPPPPPDADRDALLRRPRGVGSSWPVVGSFTRSVRWHPDSLALWAAVLRVGCAAPRAPALWLLAEPDVPTQPGVQPGADLQVRSRLAAEWGALGLRTRSLRFSSWTADKPTHLARHAALALSLDTTPLYGSHTTASDSFFASVPLLTLPAATWASRVGGSVGAAAGAPQAAADSLRAYEGLAEALLCDRRGPAGAARRARAGGSRARRPATGAAHAKRSLGLLLAFRVGARPSSDLISTLRATKLPRSSFNRPTAPCSYCCSCGCSCSWSLPTRRPPRTTLRRRTQTVTFRAIG